MATTGRRKVWLTRALIGTALALAALAWASGWSSGSPSECFGTSAQGELRHAWKLPRNGPNFRAYNGAGWWLGRTFVHSSVHAVVLDAYAALARAHPELKFIYGETGFERGGRFRPHRAHQNGLSVDFMVPVRDASGAIRQIPTSIREKFGYGLEFDDSGKLGELRIDFEAIAWHLAELQRQALNQRVRVVRVIFEPKLREQLTKTKTWPEIASLPFMLTGAWTRHDEHYHVDFEVPCQRLGGIE